MKGNRSDNEVVEMGWLAWLEDQIGGFSGQEQFKRAGALLMLGTFVGVEETHRSRFLAEALYELSEMSIDWSGIMFIGPRVVTPARRFLQHLCCNTRKHLLRSNGLDAPEEALKNGLLISQECNEAVIWSLLPSIAYVLQYEEGAATLAVQGPLEFCTRTIADWPVDKLIGFIPLLVVLGMPLYFDETSQPHLKALWQRPEVQPLVHHCWILMSRVQHEHIDLSTLPRMLMQTHLALYENAAGKCFEILRSIDDAEQCRRLLVCCREFCGDFWAMCRFIGRYVHAIGLRHALADLHRPLEERADIKARLIREVFSDLALEVLGQCGPLVARPVSKFSDKIRSIVSRAKFALSCLDQGVIDVHDLPFLSDFSLSFCKFLPNLSDVEIDRVLTRMQSIVSLVFSTRAWSYIEATASHDFFLPESRYLPGSVFQDFVSRKDLSEFETLRVFWQSVEGSRLQNESLVWMPLPKQDRSKWSSFQQRMSDTHSDLWHARRDSSVYAWVQNDTAVLTCPFEYYRRNWLRHMHAMSALPYDEAHDSSELSFLTELSTANRCVATYLSRALIERCIVQKEEVTADWCLRVVHRVVRGRATSRTARKLNLALKKGKIKLHGKQPIQELATAIDASMSKSMAARHYQVALSAKERPWRYANLDHALRCGVPVAAVNLMLSVARTQNELVRAVSFLRDTSRERFMQPLAPCMPLAEWKWLACECTTEPARLLCFLAWQHLHNNSVDLSAFLDAPLPVDSQISNSFIRSLRFSNWHTGGRVPVAGIYDGPHYAVLWSVLASFVHRLSAIAYRNLDKSKNPWHHAHVMLRVTAYTELCETAFGEDRDGVSSLFPFGFCATADSPAGNLKARTDGVASRRLDSFQGPHV
ncbi:MAG: hypothetical protein MHM6MM_006419 [Cercozoa sp. M6MM]